MVGNGSVFVTVGTTLFDALIEAVDSKCVQETILEKGYTSLVIQIGRGKHIPREVSQQIPCELLRMFQEVCGCQYLVAFV